MPSSRDHAELVGDLAVARGVGDGEFVRPRRGQRGGEQLRAAGLGGFGGDPPQPGQLLPEFAAATDDLGGGLDLAAGQLELELDAVLGGVVGHGFVHGDRFTGRRVGEKKLFFDAKSGMVGHGENIDPARRRSHDGPDPAVSLSVVDVGF